MKKTLVACIIMAMAGATLLSAAPQAVEEIVAIVNEDIITLSEYKQQFEGQIQQLKGRNLSQDAYNKEYDFLKKELLNTMITDLLLLQQAKEKNLNVNEELKNNIENIKKENNLTSDEDLRRAIQQTGMTYEQWVNQYRDFLLKQMIMMSEVYRSIVLDDSEVVRYYKQHPDEFTVPTEYKLHAVYLTAENRTPEALEALKAEIGAKLKAGADFAETAAALADPPMKEAKGDLGTLKKDEVDKDLLAAIDKMKNGELSPWVSAKNGWYLLKLDEKKESYLKPFDEARLSVQEKILGEKRKAKSDEFLARIKSESYIKILKENPLEF